MTPLQNGIFKVGGMIVTRDIALRQTNSLIPLVNQSALLNSGFLNSGYGTLWLGQKLPPFTTPTAALAPFYPVEPSELALGGNQTISSRTVQYTTDLVCHRPLHIQAEHDFTYTFDDGHGCVAEHVLSFTEGISDTYAAYYLGYFDDPFADSSLQAGGCPLNASHTFLAVWKHAGLTDSPPDFNDSSNATALFCTTSYYTQLVNATVTYPDFSVVSTSDISPKTPLSVDAFNTTQFEYVLASSVPPGSADIGQAQQDPEHRQDRAEVIVLHQDSHLSNMSLVLPTPNMVGFAIGSTHFAPDEYLDPTHLESAFKAAHQLLFAVAVHGIMATPASQTPSLGSLQYRIQAVQLVPSIALLAQLCLLVITALSCCVCYSCRTRPSALSADPDSLAQIMSLSHNVNLQKLFNSRDYANDEQLQEAISNRIYRLHRASALSSPCVIIAQDKVMLPEGFDKQPERSLSCGQRPSHPLQPIAYSWWLGMPFISLLICLIITLLLLHRAAQIQDGKNNAI